MIQRYSEIFDYRLVPVRTVQTDESIVLLFGIAMVTGEMVLENPWKPEVSAAPGLLCVLASKADFPP